jgi:hypothetical protein
MTRSFPPARGRAPEGATFEEKGPARTLNRRTLGPSAGLRKPTGPGFPPARAGQSHPPPFRVQFSGFGNLAGRSANARSLEVGADGAGAPAFLWPSPKRGMGGASG